MKHFILFFAVAVLFFSAAAETAAPSRKRGGFPPPGKDHNFQRNPAVWRAFSMLPLNEQKELMKLQHNDPEKFRAIMQEKAAKIQAEMQAKRQKVADLAAKIRDSKDDKEKTALRAELRAMLKDSFDSRINHLKRNIESNKKRIARMEEELKKRESNADALVDAITEAVISGKKPENKRRPGMPHRGPRMR